MVSCRICSFVMADYGGWKTSSSVLHEAERMDPFSGFMEFCSRHQWNDLPHILKVIWCTMAHWCSGVVSAVRAVVGQSVLWCFMRSFFWDRGSYPRKSAISRQAPNIPQPQHHQSQATLASSTPTTHSSSTSLGAIRSNATTSATFQRVHRSRRSRDAAWRGFRSSVDGSFWDPRPFHKLVGGLEHQFYFPIYWEYSSQLANIFQRGSNHQPD